MIILKEVMPSVLESLIMVSSFCIFMIFCMLSNTLLGSVAASKSNEFKFSIFLKGFIRNAFIIFGIDSLATGVSGLSKLIEIYDILPDYSSAIESISSIGIVAVIITLSYKVYGKQALEKIKAIGDLKEEDIVQIENLMGWEGRGL